MLELHPFAALTPLLQHWSVLQPHEGPQRCPLVLQPHLVDLHLVVQKHLVNDDGILILFAFHTFALVMEVIFGQSSFQVLCQIMYLCKEVKLSFLITRMKSRCGLEITLMKECHVAWLALIQLVTLATYNPIA